MNLSFPIDSVEINFTESVPFEIADALYSRDHIRINEQHFSLSVPEVADYWAADGKRIWVKPMAEVDEASVRLFLNGSVFGAVLHQQGLVPFHASSFQYKEKVVLIAGMSGAGKSSTTAAFCTSGAQFINDDINPVEVSGDIIRLKKIRSRVKLWDDSLDSLAMTQDGFQAVRPGIDKFYVPLESTTSEDYLPLHHIVILNKYNGNECSLVKPSGIEKYNLLRRHIYRLAYLRGMPETDRNYFAKLLKIAKSVDVTIVNRPSQIAVQDTVAFIQQNVLA